MTERMTFEDWQWSKGIMPWTLVHDWSEFRYQADIATLRLSRVVIRLAEPMVDAFNAFAAALARAADAFAAFTEATKEQ